MLLTLMVIDVIYSDGSRCVPLQSADVQWMSDRSCRHICPHLHQIHGASNQACSRSSSEWLVFYQQIYRIQLVLVDQINEKVIIKMHAVNWIQYENTTISFHLHIIHKHLE